MRWHSSRRSRTALGTAIAAALTVGVGVVAWRVLAPAEVLEPARVPYPSAVVPEPGPLGALASAPLIVDGRIRVFADRRQVWADAPPDFRFEQNPFWSLRRWPAELVGVVAVDDSLVVSSWSDGVLIGLDAATGAERWRASQAPTADAFTGGRTGGATVYTPAGLLATESGFVTVSDDGVIGYDPGGQRRWAYTRVPSSCLGDAASSPAVVWVVDVCDGVVHRVSTEDGTSTLSLGTAVATLRGLDCTVGSSGCRALALTMRDGSTSGWAATGSEPTPADGVARASAVTGRVAIVDRLDTDGSLVGVDAASGKQLWRWQSNQADPPRFLAADGDDVYLLTPDHDLVAVDAATGLPTGRISLVLPYEQDRPYRPGLVLVTPHFLAFERLRPSAAPGDPDDQYFVSLRPVMLVGRR